MSKKILQEVLKHLAHLEYTSHSAVARLDDLKAKIDAEIAKPDPEPVAWQYKDNDGNIGYSSIERSGQDGWTALYTEQPDQTARTTDLEAMAEYYCKAFKAADSKRAELEKELDELVAVCAKNENCQSRSCANAEILRIAVARSG